MRTFTFAAVACLLAGCTMPPPAPTTTASAAGTSRLACDTSIPPTGSHMVDRHSCDRGQALTMGSDSVATAMRQNPGAALSGH